MNHKKELLRSLWVRPNKLFVSRRLLKSIHTWQAEPTVVIECLAWAYIGHIGEVC